MSIDDFIDFDPQEGPLGRYRVIDQNICVGVMNRSAHTSTWMIDTHVQQTLDRVQQDYIYTILDMSKLSWTSANVEEWFRSELAQKAVKGYCIISKGKLSNMFTDLWIRRSEETVPIRRFSQLEDGMEWIKSVKSQHMVGQTGVRT